MTLGVASFEEQLAQHSVSRRQFLKFCGVMAATLALPARYTGRIAQALLTNPRPPLVWLEFQDCTGDSESLLRASQPGVDELLLDLLSLDYHETIMVPAGSMSERSLNDTIRDYPGQYLCVVEGSIPARWWYPLHDPRPHSTQHCPGGLQQCPGHHCHRYLCLRRRPPAAAPNPTGVVGVGDAVPGLTTLIKLPGCPANVVNLVATISHFLTFQAWPETDGSGRPYFAYDEEIHEECERHDHYEEERFVLAWGDEGHRQGWCLFKMGCRGPETHHNCPTVKWNDGTCWPIQAGHGCVGCAEERFWDWMSPFYIPLEDDDSRELRPGT
jgi:hydrogenase small subunit